jgi:hypothetical protein
MQAMLKGAIFHNIDDVLHPSERRYSSSIVESTDDIDDLNYDISLAALRLLQRKGGVFSTIPSSAIVRSDKSNNYRVHTVGQGKKPISVQESLLRRPPCRFEVYKEVLDVPIDGANGATASVKRSVHVVLDIAHNEDAMKALVKKVKMFYPDKPLRYLE